MSVFGQFATDVAISPGESFNLLANSLGGGHLHGSQVPDITPGTGRIFKSNLPPAVVNVPAEHIRGYVHNKKVNQYLVGGNLGEGSFAKVKEAFHVMVGEKVAMKVIDKKKAMQDPYVAKNFKREAKLLQMVRHPNILQLLEVIETDSSFYLITELCTGGELMKYIYKKGQLDEVETRKFMRQIVSAVDHMHKAGIIHRDLKVENMLLDSNSDIKLIDFGLSNEEYVQGENGLMHCSTQCGSPAYAAPELLGHKTYGPQVDIWSIGVNMYAMLTGCLPYTVEPFNITALHAKMLENKMNPIPDHLSETCKDLLKQLLRSNPSERLSMSGIMCHPWMNEAHTLPFGPAPFPNKLQLADIDNNILQHMVHTLKLKDSEDEMVQELLTNRATQPGAIYFLLLARLARYNKHFPRVRKPKVSRDQGYYDMEDDMDTRSTRSMPHRRSSRQSSKLGHVPLRQKGPGGDKDRPISHPTAPGVMGDPPELNLAHTMPAGYMRKRRQTMPEFMLKDDAMKAREAVEKRERAKQTAKQEEASRHTTRPSTQSVEQRHKRHTHPSVDPSWNPSHSDSSSTTLAPIRPPNSMRRNHFSTPSALNQIREDLTKKLPPSSNHSSGGTGGVINAWYSNPNSRTTSRNPSRAGSRQPSGNRMTRAASNNMTHSREPSTDDAEPDELVFHEVHDVRSSTLPHPGYKSKKKLFTIGQDSVESMADHPYLPSISEDHRSGGSSRRRSHSVSALQEKRNGYNPQTKTVEVKTDRGLNEILSEILRVVYSLKLKDVEKVGSSVMFSWSGMKFQVSASRVHGTSCSLTYQWLSGGDLQTYRERCDKLTKKLKL